MNRVPAICCPHCDSTARVRSSREMSRTVRDVYLQCNNVACGHTFVAQLSIIRTLSPSACPRTDIKIPYIPGRHPVPYPANDDLEPAVAAAGG